MTGTIRSIKAFLVVVAAAAVGTTPCALRASAQSANEVVEIVRAAVEFRLSQADLAATKQLVIEGRKNLRLSQDQRQRVAEGLKGLTVRWGRLEDNAVCHRAGVLPGSPRLECSLPPGFSVLQINQPSVQGDAGTVAVYAYTMQGGWYLSYQLLTIERQEGRWSVTGVAEVGAT